MERKTKIHAEDGKQEIFITREFDLPVELLFTAHSEPEIIEQWMSTKVLKMQSTKHGGYQFETTDPKGNKYGFNGVFHDFIPNQKITRTFQMDNTSFEPWIEYLTFESLSSGKSKLSMHVVYKSVAQRDEILKMPFAQGIDWAHNRLQEIVGKLNKLS